MDLKFECSILEVMKIRLLQRNVRPAHFAVPTTHSAVTKRLSLWTARSLCTDEIVFFWRQIRNLRDLSFILCLKIVIRFWIFRCQPSVWRRSLDFAYVVRRRVQYKRWRLWTWSNLTDIVNFVSTNVSEMYIFIIKWCFCARTLFCKTIHCVWTHTCGFLMYSLTWQHIWSQ